MTDTPDLNELYREAATLQQQGRFVEASLVYDKMLKQVPEDADIHHLKGVCFYQLGDLAAAERHMSRGFDFDKNNPSHYSNYGAVLIAQGKAKEAKEALERAVELDSKNPDAYCNLSALLQQLGQLDEAEAHILKARTVAPKHPSVLNNLGSILKEKGDYQGAEAVLMEAYEVNRDLIEININLGDALRRVGKLDEAAAILDHALELDPANVEALNNMGLVLHAGRRLADAEKFFLKVFELDQNHAMALNNLGNVFMEQGQNEKAVGAFNEAAKRGAFTAEVCTNLGNALLSINRLKEAETVLIQAGTLNPDYALAWHVLGETMRAKGDLQAAIDHWNRSLKISPDSAETLFCLGSLHASIGDSDSAMRFFRKAVATAPDNARIHSNMLMAMHYAPELTRQEIFEEHLLWAERHAANTPPRPAIADPAPDRKLKLGFASSDFRFHAVAFFFLESLKSWPKDDWEITLYSSVEKADEQTEGFKAAADHWYDASKDDDNALAEKIKADGIDILVDMDGHTRRCRLGTFALRPAPVQVSWFDYVDTTGLKAMDAFIGDPHQSPLEEEAFWVEKIYQLPHDYISYTPPTYAPEVSALPLDKNGFVTIGCFNTTHKITPQAVSAWAEILKRAPGTKLLLNTPEFSKDLTIQRYSTLFEKEGIATDRIIIAEGGPHEEFIGQYAQIDLALDPFPYAGGLNTCEALWMGVPVVTVHGDRFCGRHASAHLKTMGCPELVAADVNGYIDIAVSLINNPDKLRSYRQDLRKQMAASPLTDAKGFAADLAATLRQIWRDVCDE